MIVFLREKFIAKIFMTVVGIVFIIGTVLLFDITGGRQASSERDEEVVAKIGGTEVSRGPFRDACKPGSAKAPRSESRK